MKEIDKMVGLRLIGVSLGRTGTQSLDAALSELGLKCYGMKDVLRLKSHQEVWHKALVGEEYLEWNQLFFGFDATIGWPICFFSEELVAVFPNAKFLIMNRSPELWFESLSRSWAVLSKMQRFRFIPKVRSVLSIVEPILDRLGGTPLDRNKAISAYNRHLTNVRSLIPPKRLLDYQISDGWEPLCNFLNVPVPDSEFPRNNVGGGGLKKIVSKLIRS